MRALTLIPLAAALLTLPLSAAPAAAQTAGYDRGFFIRDAAGDFSLRIQPRFELRWTLGIEDEGGDETSTASQFSLTRGRLTLAGNAFGKDLTYEFELDVARGFFTLKDGFVEYAFEPDVRLRVGQYKRPFSRQQIISSSRLALVERSITDKLFPTGRDIGLMLHNGYERSPTFEWAFGVFNGMKPDGARLTADVVVDPDEGTGEIVKPSFSNTPRLMEPALVARLGFNHGGIKGYSEADLEGGPLRYAVAVSGLAMLDADDDDRGAVSGQLDWILKASGFSTTGGLYVTSRQEGEEFGQRALDAWGFHAQAGYVFADRYQPAVRYAYVERQDGEDWNHEAVVGMSVYWREHALKLQTDGGLAAYHDLDGDAVTDRTDFIVRSQLQVSF